jgi:hypothetical protein
MSEQQQKEFDRLYNAHFFGQHVDGMRLAHCEYFFEQGLRSWRDEERKANSPAKATGSPT